MKTGFEDKVALEVRRLELGGCGVRDAGYVIDHVIAEGSLELLRDGTGRAGKLMALDLGDAKQAAIGGSNEDFFCAV